MQELNIKIEKLDDGRIVVEPLSPGKYTPKTFWVARIKGSHAIHGLDREFIQKGDQANITISGMYQVSCDFTIQYIIVEEGEYRMSDFNEINTLINFWG